MKPILEIQNIGKKYRIQHLAGGYLSLRERMVNALRFERNKVEDFWALKDVSFEVQPGESLGIIGRNGAGKSTLLKILSKITPPTTGRIVSRGRIASLLEVGTGFHPELTGRENIFFNGSLLGMKRKEIESKFDEIVDFSGVETFLDTPLKHFSSGMQLRLAFAVAAFLEPEILIIDEVLAVGDAEFQKKCLGKMRSVSQTGRTILFVSHNLPSVRNICRSAALFENGSIRLIGSSEAVIDLYTRAQVKSTIDDAILYHRPGQAVTNIRINGQNSPLFRADSGQISVQFNGAFQRRIAFEFQIHIKKDDFVFASYSNFFHQDVQFFGPGDYEFSYVITIPNLRSGTYTVDLCFAEAFVDWFATIQNIVTVEIDNNRHNSFLNDGKHMWIGPVLLLGDVRDKKLTFPI